MLWEGIPALISKEADISVVCCPVIGVYGVDGGIRIILKCLGIRILFLSFNLLIGWQVSIWNYCKLFISLLYNCQLLCFWRLVLSVVVDVFL
jgi:hypothetical protein